jgi:hypothetical protein
MLLLALLSCDVRWVVGVGSREQERASPGSTYSIITCTRCVSIPMLLLALLSCDVRWMVGVSEGSLRGQVVAVLGFSSVSTLHLSAPPI